MKGITIMTLLLMAFASFATVAFADNSPPGVETSISYEMPEGINLNVEILHAQVWQTIEMKTEGRIAVYDCDLKWPGVDNAIYTTNTKINSMYDNVIYKALNKDESSDKKGNFSNQDRLSVDKNEVLSMFYNSKGDRYSARNEGI